MKARIKGEVRKEKEYKLNRLARRVQKQELHDNGIATTDEGEPFERFQHRMHCKKHCGMEDICLLKSKHGPHGGITISCSMTSCCERIKSWDKEHNYQIAKVEE